ncbi:hypothetical protein FRC02_004601 [Tulasnella sp. 418]|nr:hypothetical protein FRC02_004601 [Tulasnella sp. 418]
MVTSIHYTIVDAFTSSPFSGNPAAVVVLSKDHGLPDSTLQNIAAEFNLSETAFVVPRPGTAGEGIKEFGLRWFTPMAEVPLCGHATLASARVLFASPSFVSPDTSAIHFHTLSGVLEAHRLAEGGNIELQFPEGPLKQVDVTTKNHVIEKVGRAFGEPVDVVDVQVGDATGYFDFMLIQISNNFDLEGSSVDCDVFVSDQA